MDSQVAEFEDQEREWAVDKITSHKGSRSNAVFEVKWKAGDTTWLPYDRVDQLSALQDYFDVMDYIDAIHSPDPPYSLPHHQTTPLNSISMTSEPPTPLFLALGNSRFGFTDRLRGGADPRSVTIPFGYDQFADVLNANNELGLRVAVVPDNEGIGIEAQGRSPTLAQLVGLEATRPETRMTRDPREEAGGKWLDQRRSELMDEALWDNLERLKKQRQWKERGMAEREAKRRRRDDEEAMRPFPLSGSNPYLPTASSSRRRTIGKPINTNPPAPTTPAPALPPSDHDEEMEAGPALSEQITSPEIRVNPSEPEIGVTKSLVRGRIPKK